MLLKESTGYLCQCSKLSFLHNEDFRYDIEFDESIIYQILLRKLNLNYQSGKTYLDLHYLLEYKQKLFFPVKIKSVQYGQIRMGY